MTLGGAFFCFGDLMLFGYILLSGLAQKIWDALFIFLEVKMYPGKVGTPLIIVYSQELLRLFQR